jgi:hypothetical protein
VFAAKFSYPLVITLGEYGPPGLSHAGDDRDGGPGRSAPGQFLTRAVLQQAEQPELLTSGPVRRTSYQPPIMPCMASHFPPPENRWGGAAAIASKTAVNCAPMLPGH